MCAALWTRQLQHGLPGGSATSAPAPPTRHESAVSYARYSSPVGPVHLAATSAGVCAVGVCEAESSFRARADRGASSRLLPAPGAADADAVLAAAVEQLGEYFAGQRQVFTVPLDLAAATAFDRRVLDLIAAISYGQTRTYGQLADGLGQRGAARAVGHACGRNPVPLLIACHRVVRSGFVLGQTRLQGGYSGGGASVKAALLALEQGAAC
jgi:methylated-DNA-[protein]-cysteine S-methyltransferase